MTKLTSPVRMRAALLTALTALGFASAAQADFGRSNPAPLPLYKTECAACHIAYPAGMLPAPSWQQLMANLPKHFGTDASLDAATAKQISTWLQANAGTGRRFSDAPALAWMPFTFLAIPWLAVNAIVCLFIARAMLKKEA